MSLFHWILFLLAALAALAVVTFLYRRREAAGPGRSVLVALRWLVLALVILLLFDPSLPAAGGARGHRTLALVDASLSMQLPADPAAPRGQTRWQRAVAEARRSGAGQVMLFGTSLRTLPVDSLGATRPDMTGSRLLPALQAASEAGVARVLVFSDAGVEDAVAVSRWLPGLGLEVDLRPAATASVADRALSELDAPQWAEAGKPVNVQVGVAGVGTGLAPVAVVVRQGGRVLARQAVPLPAAGRVSTATIPITPQAPAGGGVVRFDVAIEPGDVVADDDHRSFYMFVGENPAGVVVISFHPDQEPRFLQPVLADALGLPVRGFLQLAPGRYLTMGSGTEAGHPVDEAEVRRVLGPAELVVLHNIGADAPAWALSAARTAPRVLVFPSGSPMDLGLPVSPGAPQPGEWYVSAQLPSSPVAPLLTPMPDPELVPPLSNLRPVTLPAGAWAPLLATRGPRGGPGSPVAVGGQAGGRRWVVALGVGYWQWAFRGDDARQLYQRLWGAVAGWLVQERRPVAAAAVRPVDRTVARGEPVRWTAAGLAADSIRLHVAGGAGADTTTRDTVLPVLRGDTALLPALPPGNYDYRAEAFSGGKAVASAQGAFTVESYSPDFVRPPVPASALQARATALSEEPSPARGRPLHASPFPYIFIILLLATEWVLRRRWGLR